jgi:N utilization substance protein A
MVMNELRGEKIDIVPWVEETPDFVAKALSPAKVKEVHISQDGGTALVIVPDYQLSLAIGKEGQNARLAARLTGLRVDIKSESQVRKEQEDAAAAAAPATEEEATEEVATEEVATEEEAPAEEEPTAAVAAAEGAGAESEEAGETSAAE